MTRCLAGANLYISLTRDAPSMICTLLKPQQLQIDSLAYLEILVGNL